MIYWRRISICCCAAMAMISILQAAERPNIVFIYTDDQAMWSLGYAGNEQAQAPNLDRLCREGAHFTNAFVTTPVCSPARASLLTSRYGTELGITDYISPITEPNLAAR